MLLIKFRCNGVHISIFERGRGEGEGKVPTKTLDNVEEAGGEISFSNLVATTHGKLCKQGGRPLVKTGGSTAKEWDGFGRSRIS